MMNHATKQPTGSASKSLTINTRSATSRNGSTPQQILFAVGNSEDQHSVGSDSCDDYCDSRDENGNLSLGKRDRKENGLVTLTHRFIELLKGAPGQTLDLN